MVSAVRDGTCTLTAPGASLLPDSCVDDREWREVTSPLNMSSQDRWLVGTAVSLHNLCAGFVPQVLFTLTNL